MGNNTSVQQHTKSDTIALGERIYQQQAIDRAEAPYLAAGEAVR